MAGADRAQVGGGSNAVALDEKAGKMLACQCDLCGDFFNSQRFAELLLHDLGGDIRRIGNSARGVSEFALPSREEFKALCRVPPRVAGFCGGALRQRMEHWKGLALVCKRDHRAMRLAKRP